MLTPLIQFAYLTRFGDSALILSQRLSELCGKGPALEEDMALANTALDLLGQARMWLSYAGEIEGRGPRRGCARLPARRSRVPQLSARGAAQQQLR